MKNTGIWLDKDKALIVMLENDTETLTTIDSNVEHFHKQGGLSRGHKRNPLDIIKESTILEREKQQLKAYFKEIVAKINDTDALVIFGPAETNEKFSHELVENYTPLSTKIKGVKKTDSMTDNQVKAWVRNFFSSN